MPLPSKFTVIRVETMERLAQCMEIRKTVFCDEQGVPFELEQDPYDTQALHFLALDRAKPVGTVRLVILPEPAEAGGAAAPSGARIGKLGRMAVSAAARGKGVGRLLAEALHEVAAKARLKAILLNAQTTAQGFYEKLGYRPVGPIFDEAGLPHQAMRRDLAVENGLGRRER